MPIIATVEGHAVDIATIALHTDIQFITILEMEFDIAEVRRAQDILIASRADGIEAEGGEHIPSRSLTVILVAAIAVGVGRIEAVHHLTNPILRLPRLAAITIEVDHVLDGLIAVGIIAEIHDLHLANLVDGETVVAIVEDWRQVEYGVEHLVEDSVSTHEVDESLRIVEHRPSVVPTVALCEDIAPLQRVVRCLEFAVLLLAAHQLGFWIEEVAVVHGALLIRSQFLRFLAQSLSKLIDAPIIVGIFQRTGSTLVDLYVARHIAQLVVILIACSTRRSDIWVDSIGSMHNGLPKRVGSIGGGMERHTLQIRIGHDTGGVIANHAVTVSRTGPFWQEATL